MDSKLFVAIILIVVGGVTLWYFLGPSSLTPSPALYTNLGANLPEPGTEQAAKLQKDVSLRVVDNLTREEPVDVGDAFKDVNAMLKEFYF